MKNIDSALDYYYDKNVREICHAFKQNNHESITKMALYLIDKIPNNSTLVPIPNKSGKAENTLLLAKEIKRLSELFDKTIYIDDILTGNSRESLYDIKKQDNFKSIQPSFFNFKLKHQPITNESLFLLDGVIATGATMNAALSILPNAQLLVYAQDKRYIKRSKKNKLSP